MYDRREEERERKGKREKERTTIIYICVKNNDEFG
jgi:hypothetical protein